MTTDTFEAFQVPTLTHRSDDSTHYKLTYTREGGERSREEEEEGKRRKEERKGGRRVEEVRGGSREGGGERGGGANRMEERGERRDDNGLKWEEMERGREGGWEKKRTL